MPRNHHILSTKQFLSKDKLREIFDLADNCQKADDPEHKNSLQGKILATLFYEPSTRTRFSFEAAMLRLGGNVISTENAGLFSSAAKGETLEDTIRIVSNYCDAVVLRHPEKGASIRASRVSTVPIINAGDGLGEHPTQALLDLYTIKKEIGRLDNLNIALVGDLLYGRTIHSLINLLTIFSKININLVSPAELKLPKNYLNILDKNNIKYTQSEKLEPILKNIDILYMTRVQKERFSSHELYDKVKDQLRIDRKTIKLLTKKSIIMHPLPRVGEIDPQIDHDPRAAYFRQAENGLYIRMALLKFILTKP